MDCVFCKIAKHEIPAEIVFENERLIVFIDIKPVAPTHLLIVPKEHIESIAHLQLNQRDILADIVFTAQTMAREKGLKGYKLVFNVGREGGQLIDHLHLHLIAGMKDPTSRNLDNLP